jgi:hypothetical protein
MIFRSFLLGFCFAPIGVVNFSCLIAISLLGDLNLSGAFVYPKVWRELQRCSSCKKKKL